MSALTETEIKDALRTNLRAAISACRDLAKLPAQGPTYGKLVEQLRLVEGAARQLGHWREDMRWMRFGFEMARFHDRIGDCIRSHAARKIFLAMAELMEGKLLEMARLQDAATGRRGPILPQPGEGPHRETRPVQVALPGVPGYIRNPSGLIMPTHGTVQ